jgi:hypothetical protein
MRRILAVALCLGLLALAGCSGRKTVYPVRGEVRDARGKPATGALVFFHPRATQEEKPVGKVNEQGEFQLTTYTEKDGAPAGEYVLTLVWPTPKKTPFDSEGGDQLRGTMAKPETSKVTFTVEATSENRVPTITLH